MRASYLGHLTSIIGLTVAGVLYTVQEDLWPGPIAWLLIGPFLAIRLTDPWYVWWTTRVAVRDSAIVHVSGLLERRTQTVAWRDVRAVDVAEPWGHRLLGLAHVTIAQAGGEAARVVIPAVDRPTLARIRQLADSHRSGEEAATARHADAPDARTATVESSAGLAAAAAGGHARPDRGRSLYRATIADLLIASLVFGQFAIAGAAAAYALWEMLETFGLEQAVLRLAGDGAVVAAAVVALVIVLTGAAMTALRFWGFEVRVTEGGDVAIAYGAIERRHRTIDASAIAGATLKRNLIEMILGRVRLGLLTTDSAAQLGTNLLLPSLPSRVVDRVVEELLHERAPASPLTGRAGALRGAALLLVSIAPAAGLAWLVADQDLPLWLGIVGVALALLLSFAIGRVLCSRMTFESAQHMVALTTLYVGDRLQLVHAASVHQIAVSRMFGRPYLTRAHYYAGAPRALTAARFSVDDVTAIARAVAEGARAALQRRLARRRRA